MMAQDPILPSRGRLSTGTREVLERALARYARDGDDEGEIATALGAVSAEARERIAARIENGLLIGRGANDMKSAIAAFVAAVAGVEQTRGTLSLLITGDEEGYATFGTPRIIDWLNEHSIRPDMILIGEPTSEARLGDIVKIGRRGSVNMWVTVPGVQGHVAYPHRADNPVPKLAKVVAALDAEPELTWMVTDDLEQDVRGAQLFGMKTILLRTGKFRPEVLDRSSTIPDAVLSSIAAMLAAHTNAAFSSIRQ